MLHFLAPRSPPAPRSETDPADIASLRGDVVDVPADLAEALRKAGLRDAFDSLTLFRQTELVTSVEAARADDTRARRIDRDLEALASRNTPTSAS